MYTYRTSINKHGGHVEIAVYDPERWEGQGGAKFGFEAEVYVQQRWIGDDPNKMVAQVSMGAIGSHSPEDALERMEVYHLAAQLAAFINDQLREESWENVGKWLEAKLPAEPTDKPLRYKFEVGS